MKPAIIDIPGIGEVAAATLAEHGITTLRKLANSTTVKLAEVPGFSTARAAKVIQAASELLTSAAPAPTGAEDDGNTATQGAAGKKDKNRKDKKSKKDRKSKKNRKSKKDRKRKKKDKKGKGKK